MKLKPVESYRVPEYPTQDDLRQEAELLRKVPKRWCGKRVVLGALAGALALMNQSCTNRVLPLGRTMGKIVVPQSLPEDEAKATKDLETRPRATPKAKMRIKAKPEMPIVLGAPIPPRSVVPEDEAKAAADQAGKGKQPSQR